jgi:hypothetical protein
MAKATDWTVDPRTGHSGAMTPEEERLRQQSRIFAHWEIQLLIVLSHLAVLAWLLSHYL